jgi:hypothetical protein
VELAYLYWSGWYENDANQTRVPTADGDTSGIWDTPPCWDDVDETTPDDGNYMTGTTDSGGYKLFSFSPFTIPSGATINDLTLYVRARRVSSSASSNIRPSLKINGTLYYSTFTGNNPPGGGSFSTYSYSYTTNPATGAAWTIADINGTGSGPLQQFGVYSSDLAPDIRVSMVYAQVNYLVADTTATFRINYLDINGLPQQYSQALTADPTNGRDRVQAMLNEGGPDYSYSCRKDVTDLVRSYSGGANPSGTPPVNGNGNAAYTVGDVGATQNANNEWAYAGWSLVTIYSSSNTTGHQLYLYDDFVYSGMNRNVDFDSDLNPGGTISGFFVPEPVGSENISARITCFVGEGDGGAYGYRGDYIAIKRLDNTMTTKLWDGITCDGNSAPGTFPGPNNVWNSQSLGMSAQGVDVDTFYVYWGDPVSSGVLQPGDTSVKIDMWTDTDSWNLVYIILSFRSATTTGGTATYLIRQ